MEQARARVSDGAIWLKAPYEMRDMCRAVPGGRWQAAIKYWRYPATIHTLRKVREAFGDQIAWLDTPELQTLAEQAAQAEKAQQRKDSTDLPPIPITRQDLPPWDHQLQAYHYAASLPAVVLEAFMGTGKSRIAVDVVQSQGDKQVLIICPPNVVDVWPSEFEEWAVAPITVVPLQKGSIVKRTQQAIKELDSAQTRGETCVLVINYEAAWRDPFAKWAAVEHWDRVIFDESHKIKSPGGKASLFCSKLAKRAKNRLGLTGTFMPHSPLDAYAQARALDPGIFGTSFHAFRNRYAIMGGYQNYQVTGWQREDEMKTKLDSFVFHIGEEVLDLPEAVHSYRTCELGTEARKTYGELEEHFISDVKGGTVTAANALSRLLRLQQVTSGFVRREDGEDIPIGNEKAQVLTEIIEDAGIGPDEPMVVFCRFRHDLDYVQGITEAAGLRYGEVSGRQNDLTDRAKYPEDVDVLGVQIQAGGVGIDLTRARYCVYYSLGFSLGDYQQSLARVHRPGQTRTTFYYHILASNTVDGKVYRALKERRAVVDSILQGIQGAG